MRENDLSADVLTNRTVGGMNRIRVFAFLAIAVYYYALPNAQPDFTRFNCQDSESYLALAHSLVEGRGYTRSLIPDAYVPHETWPPGLPWLLMPAAALTGPVETWLLAKLTMVTIGFAGVVLTWLLARRLSGQEKAADFAALLIALNPFYWHLSHVVLAEMPAYVALVGGLLLIDRVWAERRVRPLDSITSGLICGLAMLIKGSTLGLGLAPLAYFYGARRSLNDRRRLIGRYLCFGIAFAIPQIGWMARNATLDGSGFDAINQVRMIRQADPCNSDSETVGVAASLRTALYNVRTFIIYEIPKQVIPGLWQDAAFDWPDSGKLALILTLAVLLLAAPWTGINGIHLVLLPMVVLTIQLPLGYAPRYWLPICGLLSLLCVLNMSRILARFTWTRGFQVLGLVVVSIGLTLNLQTYVRSHDRFNAKGPWRELAEFFEMAREHPLSTTGVLTPNCHAFQLITGKPAPMPLQRIDPHYDHLVARMDGSGVQPPPGSRLLWTRDPWAMFELPRRMALADLIDVEKYAPRNGLYVEPYDPTIRELPEP